MSATVQTLQQFKYAGEYLLPYSHCRRTLSNNDILFYLR